MSEVELIDWRHQQFVLHEVLQVAQLTRYPHFSQHSIDTFDAALELAQQLALTQFQPHNREADLNEPRVRDGKVHLLPAVAKALAAYREAGFFAAGADETDGGMQLPYTIALACDGLFAGANVATAGYPMLTKGVAHLIAQFGTAEQKQRFLQPLHDGRFFGTMCLSETQAGSSLGDISTRAEPIGNGDYRISGAKMWISGGEHELAENIVHMVLARTPDAPPGVRGISLFIVPRYRVAADGSVGEDNDVRLAGVNHKLGQRGIVNTFLKFGEHGACIGHRVGPEHRGLAQMFVMMNEARIGVGIGAIMLGNAGYRYALAYARERRQGRHPDQKDPQSQPVPIIEHADVRRMLLQQRVYVEGAHALALYAATLVDTQGHDPDAAVRARAGTLLELLTPIIKAWSAQWCVQANDLAIQVLGGYGYTREYPVEQFYRDNRLNPIHEGSNGIQALDLLGRKVLTDNGAGLRALLDAMASTIESAAGQPELIAYAQALAQYAKRAADATLRIGSELAAGKLRQGLANASQYLTVMGHLCVGWMWLRQAQTASAALPAAHSADARFYRGKLHACRFFFQHELPTIEAALRLLESMDSSVYDMQIDWF
ncbi:MAG: acyl-CoA dehydrogenase [Gammaproteobacteria bacterium HGW-Gammaproteobacteria-2]|jgi:butyryl-CoA dehydrogenase|nr:MAG: acyl-CoA dehydrogenase [Gammaproteobacteria bacterium HGW-Gammaproteobacteria-2]